MNKGELIEKVATECGVNISTSRQVIESMLHTISEALASDDKVKLVGFGIFSVAQRASRKGRNPNSGNIIHIPAKKVLRFKAGTNLVAAVRSDESPVAPTSAG